MNPCFQFVCDADDDTVVIRAIHNGRRVGILCGRFYPQGLARLEEVEVADALPLEQTWLDFLLRRSRTRCYRGLGIGSRLLTEFLAICQSRGVREVAGWVVEKDATPRPLDWYAGHGFQKRAPIESASPERYRPPNTIWEVVWNPPISASE